MLVSNYGTNDLTYYPGGYGSLNSAAMKHLAVGTKPIGVKVFDADYDGFFDIITPLTNNITISYGVDNNDNFLSPEYLNIINPHLDQDKAAPGAAIDFSDMILVDINLDTLYDIIILDRFYEDLYVLLNLGAREFTKPYWFKTGKDPRKVVASDFNNDGCPDLAVMNQTGKTITFFRNELCE
ncbi:MAG: VCBS repeat-containing protein [Deltaproteobacteria bacterium]|nr:VCBS repeat-containing protein [Deltaproteobacteria bacterium]